MEAFGSRRFIVKSISSINPHESHAMISQMNFDVSAAPIVGQAQTGFFAAIRSLKASTAATDVAPKFYPVMSGVRRVDAACAAMVKVAA
jgi:hypothetical protein